MKDRLKKVIKYLKRKRNGTVSVFLCLILVPVMMIALLATDFARIYSARVVISDSLELAMNGALAYYDAELMDHYGLFAMNQGAIDENIRNLYTASLNASTISGAEDYEHILTLLDKEFEIIKVNNTQICNDEVTKQQILEYMKFRAPVCLTDEFLQKLESLKSTNEQMEIVKKQITFAKSMAEVQGLFEKKKKNLEDLNMIVQRFQTLKEINDALDDNTRDYLYCFIPWVAAIRVTDNIKDISINTKSSDPYSDIDSYSDLVSKIRDEYVPKILAQGDSKSAARSTVEAFQQANRYRNYIDNLIGTDKDNDTTYGIYAIEPEPPDAPDPKMGEDGKPIPPEDDPEWLQYEEDQYQYLIDHAEWEEKKDSFVGNNNYLDNLGSEILFTVYPAIDDNVEKLSSFYDDAKLGESYASQAITDLAEIERSLQTAKTDYYNWGKAVEEDMDPSEQKEEMQKSVQEYAGFFSPDAVFGDEDYGAESALRDLHALQTIVEKDQIYFKNVYRFLECEKFNTKCMVTDSGKSIYNEMYACTTSSLDFDEQCRTLSDCIMHIGIETSGSIYSLTGEIPQLQEKSVTIEDNAFYKKLMEYCEKAQDLENPPERTKAEGYLSDSSTKADNMGDASKEDTSSFPKYNWGTLGKDYNLPSKGNYDTPDTSVSVASGSLNDEDERFAIVDQAESTINEASGFLKSLESILENGIESLYIAEYGMQMLSYYNCDKKMDPDSKELKDLEDKDLETISGYPLKVEKAKTDEDGNTPYKGELEYVLWGSDSSTVNVFASMAMIFGIRLVLNSIYAFTNGTVREETSLAATAVTAYAPYLQPIVSVIMKFAVATAETIIDTSYIKQGYDVALYKDDDSWVSSLQNSAMGADVRNKGVGGLRLNYGEYTRFFLIMKYFVGGENGMEKKMMNRMADCIQVNTTNDITQEYTMVAVNAKVGVKTSFIKKVSEYAKEYGKNLNNGLTLENEYDMNVQSILGY